MAVRGIQMPLPTEIVYWWSTGTKDTDGWQPCIVKKAYPKQGRVDLIRLRPPPPGKGYDIIGSPHWSDPCLQDARKASYAGCWDLTEVGLEMRQFWLYCASLMDGGLKPAVVSKLVSHYNNLLQPANQRRKRGKDDQAVPVSETADEMAAELDPMAVQAASTDGFMQENDE